MRCHDFCFLVDRLFAGLVTRRFESHCHQLSYYHIHAHTWTFLPIESVSFCLLSIGTFFSISFSSYLPVIVEADESKKKEKKTYRVQNCFSLSLHRAAVIEEYRQAEKLAPTS